LPSNSPRCDQWCHNNYMCIPAPLTRSLRHDDRRKQGPIPEALRAVAANVVQSVSKSVATYYAFGSVYATDST
jgi:hypothetical protein